MWSRARDLETNIRKRERRGIFRREEESFGKRRGEEVGWDWGEDLLFISLFVLVDVEEGGRGGSEELVKSRSGSVAFICTLFNLFIRNIVLCGDNKGLINYVIVFNDQRMLIDRDI